MESTVFKHMPFEGIPVLFDESMAFWHKPISAFRYPVVGGWIVGTIITQSGAYAIAQSFVPDPDFVWEPVDKEQKDDDDVTRS